MPSTELTTATDTPVEREVTPPAEKKMRVAIERTRNPEVIIFKFDRMLCTNGRKYDLDLVSGEVKEKSYERSDADIEGFVAEFARKIFAIPGVMYNCEALGAISISQYEMTVWKGRAFNDADIEKAVTEVVAETFDLTVDQLDVKLEPAQDNGYGYYSLNRDLFGEVDGDEE
jgi:hypothetical protein